MSLASPRRAVSPHPPVPSPITGMSHHHRYTSLNHGGVNNVTNQMKQTGKQNIVTFDGIPQSSGCSMSPRGRLRRQYSTTKQEIVDYHQQTHRNHYKNYPNYKSVSCESSATNNPTFNTTSDRPCRNNSYPTRRPRPQPNCSSRIENKSSEGGRGITVTSILASGNRRLRPKPPPLNFSSTYWDSGQTSETDCSVASSSSPPRSSDASSPLESSPNSSPVHVAPKSPGHSPRDPNRSPRSGGFHYISQPPLSPIPHSPQNAMGPRGSWNRLNSPFHSPSSPRSPCSPRMQSSPLHSPGYHSPGYHSPAGGHRSPSPVPPVGNLARLASRRRSNAVPGYGMKRRTSNFLELPETDYERQRRYCSLPEHGYNPRHTNEIYRLRAFSISPKGALIKLGDHMASRRSRSSAGSTTNTSKQASRNSSRGPSPLASRDVSPMNRSPVAPIPPSYTGKSPWSSHQSGLEEYSSISHRASGNSQTFFATSNQEENDEETNDDIVKHRVCILGYNNTGKTALVNQFLTSEYMNTYDASLDEEFGERSVSVVLDGEESELVFIDHTNGEMSVENTLSTYEPHGCVIVYSVVDRDSFQMAEDILGYLWRMNYADGDKSSIILVGNKVDLERSRVIPQEEGKKLAISFGAKFIETSAGIQHNVDELLVGVLKQIRLREQKRLQQNEENSSGAGCSNGGGGEEKGMFRRRSKGRTTSTSALSSPLHTLQVARDILAKVCLNSKSSSFSKSCENMHVL